MGDYDDEFRAVRRVDTLYAVKVANVTVYVSGRRAVLESVKIYGPSIGNRITAVGDVTIHACDGLAAGQEGR